MQAGGGDVHSAMRKEPGLPQIQEGRGDKAGGEPAVWRTVDDTIRTVMIGRGGPLTMDLR